MKAAKVVCSLHVARVVTCKYSLATPLSEHQGHSLNLDCKVKKKRKEMHTSLTYNEGSRCVSLLVTSVVTLSKVIVVWATISRHMAYLF